tara:strand:- start:474 stop:740 length:267 start_codon:yes stop_codon:yes gene_type:complete
MSGVHIQWFTADRAKTLEQDLEALDHSKVARVLANLIEEVENTHQLDEDIDGMMFVVTELVTRLNNARFKSDTTPEMDHIYASLLESE